MKKAQTKKKTPAAKRKSKAKTEPEERSVGDFTPVVRCAHSKMVPVSTLQRHPRNPNTHPEAQIKLLANIIAKSGFRSPIVVSTRSGYITKGHGRLDAAELLGLKDVPVDYQDYDSEESEMADMVADNKIASLAEMDRAVLKEIMEELDTGAFDMLLTGFDLPAIESLMTAIHPDDIDHLFQRDDEPKGEEQNTITLHYIQEDYERVMAAFKEREGTREAVVMELLGL